MDSDIFIGTRNCVYVSSNGGTRWLDVTPNHPAAIEASVLGLLANGSTLYAGVNHYGVFVSSDGGTSWSDAGIPNTGALSEWAASGDWMIAGNRSAQSYQSIDHGVSWAPLADPVAASSVCIRDSLGFIGNWEGIFRSTDTGTTWTNVRPTGREVRSLAISGQRVVAGVDNTILSSSDAGLSWSPDSTILECRFVNSLLFVSAESGSEFVFAGTDSGAFRSSDSGMTWHPANSGLTSKAINCFAFQKRGFEGNPALYACSGGGVFRSTDFGETWRPTGTPEGTWKIASSGKSLLAGSSVMQFFGPSKYDSSPAYSRCATYRSDDLGDTWTERDSGLVEQSGWMLSSVAIHPVGGGGHRLFAGLSSTNLWGLGAVLSSTDDGLSWWPVLTDSSSASFPTVVSISSDLLVGLTEDGIIRSSDNGTTWFPSDSGISTPPYDAVPPRAPINAFSVDGTRIYAGCGNARIAWEGPITGRLLLNYIFASGDGGATWERVDSGFTKILFSTKDTGSVLASLYATGSHIVVGTRQWNQSALRLVSGGIYHIVHTGAGWTLVDSSLMGIQVHALVGTNSDFFAGTSKGVFHSTDHGSTWDNVSSGMADTVVTSLTIAEGYLFAATSSGIWRRPLSELTAVDIGVFSGSLLRGFRLDQNYPNPFNPSTTIRYGLPVKSHVTLTVFNTLGQEVATLVQGEKEAGYHEVKFEAYGLSSGVYFYRLIAGNFVHTRGLLVIR